MKKSCGAWTRRRSSPCARSGPGRHRTTIEASRFTLSEYILPYSCRRRCATILPFARAGRHCLVYLLLWMQRVPTFVNRMAWSDGLRESPLRSFVQVTKRRLRAEGVMSTRWGPRRMGHATTAGGNYLMLLSLRDRHERGSIISRRLEPTTRHMVFVGSSRSRALVTRRDLQEIEAWEN